MENQEKETSLEYFFRITKNNAINLGRLIEAYVPAKKIYDMEIEEAKKDALNEAKKMYDKEIEKAYIKGFANSENFNPNKNK